MKFLKFLYYLLFFLGFFPDTVQANSLYLHLNKHFEIHQDKFASGSKEKDWLVLLCLKENTSLEIHSEWAGLSIQYPEINNKPVLVNAWKVLDEAGETGLARRVTDVEFIDDYLKNYPDVDPTVVASSIKTKGWQKWVDEFSRGIILSKSNLLNVFWKNNIVGHRSMTDGLKFWNNTSKEFKHLVDGDFYLKFDHETGNLLFGNHRTAEILGFYEGTKNIEIINTKGLDGILGKLKIYHGIGSPSYLNLNVSSGARIIANPDKTATIVGNFKRYPWNKGDMKELIPELLGDLKTQQFGAKKGGFNVLNVADEVVSDWSKFWDEFNKPWLEDAIKRGDDIWAASNPLELNLLFKNLKDVPIDKIKSSQDLANYLKSLNDPVVLKEITGFGNEVKLLSENGYVFDSVSKIFIK